MMVNTSMDGPIEQLQNTLEVIQLQINKNVQIIKDTEVQSQKYQYDMGRRNSLRNAETYHEELLARFASYKQAINTLKGGCFNVRN